MTTEALTQIMDYLIYIAIIIGLGTSLYILRKVGKGVMNIVFASFGMSLLLVGLSDLFVAVYDGKLEDISLHVSWHVIAYMGFICLIWGGYRITEIMSSPNPKGFSGKDIAVFSSMLILTAIIFAGAPVWNESLYGMIHGSFFEMFGLHHLIAFLLGIIGAFYLFYIKGGPKAGKAITFVGIFLLLLGIQHLWELTNETFHLLPIQSDTIEMVERFIVLPATIFFLVGQKAILKFISGKE